MAVDMPKDWVDRLSRSLRAHEGERKEAGESLPRYQTLSVLGRGGMGEVHRAWDRQLSREVALKVLLERPGGDPEARERFLREAQMASRLSHQHIVPVYDQGELMGQAYMAMQLIDGTTIDKAGLDLRGNLAAIRDASRALHHAHQAGVVHRDVKPSNLLVDRKGWVYVTDFGVARQLDVPAKLTLTGVIMGTPAYMAPEQAQGRPVDARSDVYSLGAAMYHIVSGRPPFEETDAVANVVAAIHKDPPPPQAHKPNLPSAVQKIIQKAMEKEPEHRYATADELADDIQRYLDGEPIHARPAPLRFKIRRMIVRNRGAVVASAIAGVILLALIITYLLLPGLDPELRRYDRAVGKGSLEEAKSIRAELAPAYASNPLFQEITAELQARIDRKLESDAGRLIEMLRVPRLEHAKALLDSMRAIPIDSGHSEVEKAERLVSNVRAAVERIDSIRNAFNPDLESGNYVSAKSKLEELQAISTPGIEGTLLKKSQTHTELRAYLIRWLKSRIGTSFHSGELRCLHELDPVLFKEILSGLKEPSRLAWEIQDENPSLDRLRVILARLEGLHSEKPCTDELEFARSRYGSQILAEWGNLELKALKKNLRNHAVAAFEAASKDRMKTLREFLVEEKPTERDLVGELDSALGLLMGIERINEALPENRDEAGRLMDELAALEFRPEYAQHAKKLLGKASLQLKNARAERLALEIGEACRRKDLPAAEKLLVPLLKVALPPDDPLVRGPLKEVADLRAGLEASFRSGLADLERFGKEGNEGAFQLRLEELRGNEFGGLEGRARRVSEKVLTLAKTLSDRGEMAGATTWLTRAIALDAGNPVFWERRGLIHWKAGSWAEAEVDWRRALQLLEGVRNALDLRRTVVLCRRLGTFEAGRAAADRLGALPNLAPESSAEVGLLRGQLLYLEGAGQKDPEKKREKFAQALKDLGEAANADPNNGRIPYWAGVVRYAGRSGGDPDLVASLGDFNRASQLGLKASHLQYQIARAQVNLVGSPSIKDSRLAEALMTRVLDAGAILDEDGYVAELHELNRDSSPRANRIFRKECLIVRARARFDIARPSKAVQPDPKQLDACLEDCEAALKIDSNAHTARLYRGFVRFYRGQYKDAKTDFGHVRKNSPYESERKKAEAWSKKLPGSD